MFENCIHYTRKLKVKNCLIAFLLIVVCLIPLAVCIIKRFAPKPLS